MQRVRPRWTIRKRDGRWLVYDRGVLWDWFHCLQVAHTIATQNAVADVLYSDGGLTCLENLKREAGKQYG